MQRWRPLSSVLVLVSFASLQQTPVDNQIIKGKILFGGFGPWSVVPVALGLRCTSLQEQTIHLRATNDGERGGSEVLRSSSRAWPWPEDLPWGYISSSFLQSQAHTKHWTHGRLGNIPDPNHSSAKVFRRSCWTGHIWVVGWYLPGHLVGALDSVVTSQWLYLPLRLHRLERLVEKNESHL
jgi:hypothetical protein